VELSLLDALVLVLLAVVVVVVAPVTAVVVPLEKLPALPVTPETCVEECALVLAPPDPNVPVEPPTPLGE
jgi:hypothetical protein